MKHFKPYDLNQPMLLTPDMRDWLPPDHLAVFISEIVESLDLTPIYDAYNQRSRRGQPPTDPRLIVKLLIYGYSVGIRSSRKIEKATYENVAFRYLAGDQHPDHDVIAHFRNVHSEAFADLFLEVLRLCQRAGLVKLGHVSIDGTKIKANAKKSLSRRYKQLRKSEAELAHEIEEILAEAEKEDKAEDKKFGKGKVERILPAGLLDRKKRLSTIKRLLSEMEAEAQDIQQENARMKEEMRREDTDWMEESGEKFERRPPKNLTNRPAEEIIQSRRNPTDYESRIMKDHQTGGYIQGYNCQLCVDADTQVIVANDVFNQPTDKRLLRPLARQVIANIGKPRFLSADTGYFSERDIVAMTKLGIDPYIPPTKDAVGKRIIRTGARRTTVTGYMREKLTATTGKRIYRRRKTIVEPVFGQFKGAKNFRQFNLRGIEKVKAEWQLMAIGHNLQKLHKYGP